MKRLVLHSASIISLCLKNDLKILPSTDNPEKGDEPLDGRFAALLPYHEFSKIVEAVKANFNEKFDEYRRQWDGGIMGVKSQAKSKIRSETDFLLRKAAQRAVLGSIGDLLGMNLTLSYKCWRPLFLF